MKNLLTILLFFIAINTFSQQKATINYTLNSTLGASGVSDIRKGGATITYDFDAMSITVRKPNNSYEIYNITSSVNQGVSSKGEEYSEVYTKMGTERYQFRLLSNRVLIIHISSRTGIVYYN